MRKNLKRNTIKTTAGAVTLAVLVAAGSFLPAVVLPFRAEAATGSAIAADTAGSGMSGGNSEAAGLAGNTETAAGGITTGRGTSGSGTISGMVGRFVSLEDKISLEELEQHFPETVVITAPATGESGRTQESGSQKTIRVHWESTEDYDQSDLHYLEFDPVADNAEDTSVLSEALSAGTVNVPYIGVFIENPENIAADGAGSRSSGETGVGSSFVFYSGAKAAAMAAGDADTAANEAAIYSFLRNEMGLNTAGAVGILANIRAESSFNPAAVGDEGTSYGICQWHNSRRTALFDYCSRNGLDASSLNGQLQYLRYEAETDYPNTLRSVRSQENTADGAYAAAYVWCRWYEVPENTERTSNSRGNLARDVYFPKYAGSNHSDNNNAGNSGNSGNNSGDNSNNGNNSGNNGNSGTQNGNNGNAQVVDSTTAEGVRSFVTRLYSRCLGRTPDAAGLEGWCQSILNSENRKQRSIEVASDGFFHSAEFTGKQLDDSSYVTTLYETFLNREPDSQGFRDWVSQLESGVSRDDVLNGFANSQEFTNLMAQYGIQ